MGGPWYEVFRTVCAKVCAAGKHPHPAGVLLFYVARWSQKTTGEPAPNAHAHPPREVELVARRIARNLAADGATVDRLFQADRDELTGLKRLLLASAGPRCGENAALDFAEEALQKIALVLLLGTPPSRAEERLETGPTGPPNEYIFTSPFPFWAKAVVINLIKDEYRRERRKHRGAVVLTKASTSVTRDVELRTALGSLPRLLEAIRTLPKVQRSVMVMSLCRSDIDEFLAEHLQEQAPDLFGGDGPRPGSDKEIADLLATTPKLVAANRHAARKKLVRDPKWAQLLDALLPHRSTRPPLTEGQTDE
jgi:hypothetical protein